MKTSKVEGPLSLVAYSMYAMVERYYSLPAIRQIGLTCYGPGHGESHLPSGWLNLINVRPVNV